MHSLFISEKNTPEIFSPRTQFKVLAIKKRKIDSIYTTLDEKTFDSIV